MSASHSQKIRRDGWMPERQLRILDALAGTRSVGKAAAFAGMGREGAYRFRAATARCSPRCGTESSLLNRRLAKFTWRSSAMARSRVSSAIIFGVNAAISRVSPRRRQNGAPGDRTWRL
jgi:uncharacterized membrane protein